MTLPPPIDPAEVRQLFPGLEGTAYLNTAAIGVGSALSRDAWIRAGERWAEGRFDWGEAEQAGTKARGAFATLIGAQTDEIALVPSVSAGAGIVAASLPPARAGENVLVADNEFSSNYFPWLLLRDRGYDVRTLSVDASRWVDAYADAADAGTRLIAVSAVHSATGYRANVSELSRVAARSGAWLFVDACQAVGAVPIDVNAEGIDFLAASSHKFLLGSRGTGYLFVRRSLIDRIRPMMPGWRAARKPNESFYGPTMELSATASKLDASLAWFCALVDAAAFDTLERFGFDRVLARNARLSRRLHDAVAANVASFEAFDVPSRSTIVSVPVTDAETTMARLASAGVVASMRAGRIRLSVHFYNLDEEIDRAARILAE
jgi:selenocysteine lyase/cysteine desulfurase